MDRLLTAGLCGNTIAQDIQTLTYHSSTSNMAFHLKDVCSSNFTWPLNMMQGSRVRPIWSHMRPNFSRVRQKKNVGRTGASSHSPKKKSLRDSKSLLFDNRHVRLIAWSKPIRDSEGRTPPLIGRGPDTPVLVCVCVRLKMRVLLLSDRERGE